MGVNLACLRSLPKSSGHSRGPPRPSGRPARWLAPSVAGTYRYSLLNVGGPKCNSAQNCSNKIQITIRPALTGRSCFYYETSFIIFRGPVNLLHIFQT